MANHKSAIKRARQTLKKNEINKQILTRIKTNINKFVENIKSKDNAEIRKTFSLINSSLARAAKKGLVKKEFVSRKLSSLSKQIKNI